MMYLTIPHTHTKQMLVVHIHCITNGYKSCKAIIATHAYLDVESTLMVRAWLRDVTLPMVCAADKVVDVFVLLVVRFGKLWAALRRFPANDTEISIHSLS